MKRFLYHHLLFSSSEEYVCCVGMYIRELLLIQELNQLGSWSPRNVETHISPQSACW